MLIEHIKQLQSQLDFSINRENQMMSKFNFTNNKLQTELERKRKQLSQEKRINESLEIKIRALNEEIASKRLLPKQIERLTKLYNHCQASLNKELKLRAGLEEKLYDLQRREMQTKTRYPFKNLEFVRPVQPVIIANSLHQIKDAQDAVKRFQGFIANNQEQKLKALSTQNSKLREWLKRFIEGVERILKLRLQKLRQIGPTEQEIYTEYQYLGKLHLNTLNFFTAEQFPFTQMLNDFYLIVSRADQNKIELDKMSIVNQAKALDRQVVTLAIDALRKFHSVVIQEFILVGAKRKQIAEEYKKVIRSDLCGMDWLEQVKVEDIYQLINWPSRVYNELQKDLEGVKNSKSQVRQNLQYAEPAFAERLKKIQSFSQTYLKSQKNRPNEHNHMLKREHESSLMGGERIRFTEDLLEDDDGLTSNQRNIKQNSTKLTLTKKNLDKFIGIPFEKERRLLNEQVNMGRSPKEIQEEYVQLVSRGQNYNPKSVERQNQMNSEGQLGGGRNNLFQTNKKKSHQQQDIEI